MLSEEDYSSICRRYTLKCPICEAENTHNRLKRDMVRPVVSGGDGHPIENKWTLGGYELINPLEFFWGICGRCHYAGELESPEYRQAERNLSSYRSKLRPDAIKTLMEGVSTSRGLAVAIGSRLNDSDPAVALLAKFYLGVYSHCQQQKIIPGNIARCYLRIGWIFRDLEQ